MAQAAPLIVLACAAGLFAGCAVAQSPATAPGGSLYGQAYSPAAAYPAAPANPAYPPPGPGSPPPGNSGVVAIGATEAAPTGHDVVPVSLTTMSPAVPGVPGAPAAGTAPDPIVAGPVPADKAKSDDDGFDISKLAPEHVWASMRTAAGYGPDEKIARAAFQDGLDLMHQKKFDEAAAKFYTASWRWPDSALEEDSLFLLGECYFFADRYAKAYDAYANLLKKRENTRYLDTVMWRAFDIGRYWELADIHAHHWPVTPNFTDKTQPWFDTGGNALGAYQQVRLHDSMGPLADYALMATANYHFRNRQWEEAAESYDSLRKDYPKSKFQMDAHVLDLQSVTRIYQGPYYDAAPLNRAKEIADQTLKQFKGRLGDEEHYVVETSARIVEQKAQREWAMARYYDDKQHYGAARQYYKSLIDTYPRTPLAEKAEKRLQELKGKPDNPPNHFKWLTGLFEREK
jgi:TolA-binding protein